jgi:hypothetical protein
MPRKATDPAPDPTEITEAVEELMQALEGAESFPVSKPDYFEVLGIPKPQTLAPITGNICPNCQQKIRTDLTGNPLCPAELPECPRFYLPSY